jgi:hypothetical protein
MPDYPLTQSPCLNQSKEEQKGDYGSSLRLKTMTFPSKLYRLLKDVAVGEAKGDIVLWLPGGSSFRMHKPVEFSAHLVLNSDFKTQTKLKSFTRQVRRNNNSSGGL